jgi:hypothetical protein
MNPTTAIVRDAEAVAIATWNESNRRGIAGTRTAGPASRRKREIHIGLGATTSESTKRRRRAFRPAIRRSSRRTGDGRRGMEKNGALSNTLFQLRCTR